MKKKLLIILFIYNFSHAQISDFKHIDFTRADNIARLNKEAELNNLPILVHNLTSNLSTKVEKFRAIHTWVCENIRGDSNQFNTVSRNRRNKKNDSIAYIKWNEKYKKIAFRKLLKHKKTMCTGYAYLIKELCFLANIECEIIDGYGRTVNSNIFELDSPNHSWNAVKLSNKWYLCDATWSSGYMNSNDSFMKNYIEGYFLADPILFSKNHFPLSKNWFLNDDLINSEFVSGPIVYEETFNHKIIPVQPEKLQITVPKNTEINFSFKFLHDIFLDQISLIKIQHKNTIILNFYDLKKENDLVSFKHRFKSKGSYDVHLKIKNDIVITYSVKVTKD